MAAPFHLPSQQSQVNPARQVHLEPPGGHDPQWDQTRLIFPETHKCACFGDTNADKVREPLRELKEITCGPTTPVGPGGPVFPWNPCGHEEDGSKKTSAASVCWSVCVCVCVLKTYLQIYMTSPALLFDLGDLEVHPSQQAPVNTSTLLSSAHINSSHFKCSEKCSFLQQMKQVC